MSTGYLAVGQVLQDRYEILRELGRGGHSVVYAVRDRRVGAKVALKLLVPPPTLARAARERLGREVQAVRALAHPNIVGVHDYFEDGPNACVVMDLVDGPDLARRLRELGPLPVDQAVRLGREIAEALATAHHQGIVHRDVKPENILFESGAGGGEGRARLTDFGSARLEGQATLTGTGDLVGTLAYAAPELLAGDRGDARADLYALGVTLFEALTGQLPPRPSPHLPPPAVEAGFHPQAQRPDVPGWLDAAVARATALRPESRFATATLLAEMLGTGAAELTAPAPTPAAPTPGTCSGCGEASPFELALCPACLNAGIPGGRRLLFVAEATAGARLEELLGVKAAPAALRDAARGRRPLVKLPSALALRVAERLGSAGLAVVTRSPGEVWQVLPVSLLLMLVAVVGTGLYVGVTLVPPFLVGAPLVGLLLLLSAHYAASVPLLGTQSTRNTPPALLTGPVVERLATLSPGPAKSLMADVVRLGQDLLRRDPDSRTRERLRGQLQPLVAAAATAAGDLAGMEEILNRSDAQRRRTAELPSAWWDGLTAAERSRDELTQHLLEVIAVLNRALSAAVRGFTSGDALLVDLTQELNQEVRRSQRAAAELNPHLGNGE